MDPAKRGYHASVARNGGAGDTGDRPTEAGLFSRTLLASACSVIVYVALFQNWSAAALGK
jgi:hypothetical protein